MEQTMTLTQEQIRNLQAALVHLAVAERQSIPSDDQIIMDHVRDAILLLRPIVYPKKS